MCDEHEHHLTDMHNAEAKELKKTRGTSLPKHDGCEKCDIFRKHIIMAIQIRGHYKEDAQKDIGEAEIIMSVEETWPEESHILQTISNVLRIFCTSW